MSFDTQLGFGLVVLLIGVTIVGKYLSQDPNTKRFKRTLIYFNTDTVCKFSGKFPLSGHKTTLKQQINGQTRLKMKEKDILFCLVFTACSVLGRLLAYDNDV